MERRKALKNIGLGSAALFSSSALFGALQSCSPSAPEVGWLPVFFTPAEAAQMEKICEAIAPKTSTPGATDAGVVNHLDQALKVLYKEKDSDYFRRGLAAFVKSYDDTQDTSFNKATTEQATQVINDFMIGFENDDAKSKAYYASLQDENSEKSEEFLMTYFTVNVVPATFRSYFTSELVGETVMAYDPIPQVYEGCIPYEAGTKAWSSV